MPLYRFWAISRKKVAIDDPLKAEYRQTALRRRRQELPFGWGIRSYEIIDRWVKLGWFCGWIRAEKIKKIRAYCYWNVSRCSSNGHDDWKIVLKKCHSRLYGCLLNKPKQRSIVKKDLIFTLNRPEIRCKTPWYMRWKWVIFTQFAGGWGTHLGGITRM